MSRDDVHRVHVSRGVSRVRSAASGALGGAAFGFSMDYLIYQPGFRESGPLTARYTLAGAAFGMITGAIWPSESWRRIKRPFSERRDQD